MALDLRARRIRSAPLLHAARKGVRGAARASGDRSRARLHRGRCGGRRRPVRPAFAVLRSSDRSRRTTTQDTAGDYDASRNERPHNVPDFVPYGIPGNVSDGVPDRFTIRVRNGIAVKGGQHFSTLGLVPSLVSMSALLGSGLGSFCSTLDLPQHRLPRSLGLRVGASLAKVLADMLTRRRSRRAEVLRAAAGGGLKC